MTARLVRPYTPAPDLSWQDSAACKTVDPAVFFPIDGSNIKAAKKVCQGCGVKTECLEYALEKDFGHGVYGGTSERERRRLRAGKRLEAAA